MVGYILILLVCFKVDFYFEVIFIVYLKQLKTKCHKALQPVRVVSFLIKIDIRFAYIHTTPSQFAHLYVCWH